MAVDPYYDNVVLLSHMDGVNGSTIFVDEKANTMTASGSAQLDTSIKKFGTASGSFTLAGSGYVTVPSSTDFDIGGGEDYTIEMWIKTPFTGVSGYISRTSPGFYNGSWILGANLDYTVNGHPTFAFKPTDLAVVSMTAPINVCDGNWHYLAVVKSGTTYTLYVDGVSGATLTDATGISGGASLDLRIGRYDHIGGGYFDGNIDEVRLTKGVARVITEPDAPFPNTSILLNSITPVIGSTDGGMPVTLIGEGFDPAATAAIDGNDLTDLVVVDDTTITGVTPAGTVGVVDVTVTNP